MTDAQQLIKCLRQEGTLQMRHCRLLEAQQRALLECDRARFCTLQEEHAELLALLERQEETRAALLRDADGHPCTLADLLPAFSPRDCRAIEGLRDGLHKTLDRARTLSQRNQKLIQNEIDYLAFTLDLFVEAGRNAETRYSGYMRMGGRLLLDRRA